MDTGNSGSMKTKDTNPKDAVGSAKPSYAAVPIPVLYELGAALHEGSRKYGGYNWRIAGVRTSVYIDAARRHMDAFNEGEDIDPDSGLSHVTKAIASLTVLRDAQIQDNVTDDRPPRTMAPFMANAQQHMDEIAARYPDPRPPYTEAEVAHTRSTPVQTYPGQTIGYEVQVMLPAEETDEGFVWMQQGDRRTDPDHSLAIAQALRDDGYGQRVVRVVRVSHQMELMYDGSEWINGEHREIMVTVFPGDPSLMEASLEECAEIAAEVAQQEVLMLPPPVGMVSTTECQPHFTERPRCDSTEDDQGDYMAEIFDGYISPIDNGPLSDTAQ